VRTDLEASFAASGHDKLIHWLPNKTAQTAYRETARHFLTTQIPPPSTTR